MHPALYVSKTGLEAQQTDLNVISNNLANVSTVGFKKDRAVFEDLLYQTVRQPGAQSSQNTELPSGLQLGTGVRVVSTHKIHTEGNIQQTGNALDMAIDGRGFLQITLPDGSTAYTRNGQFQLNSDGEIVTNNGYTLDPGINIPVDAQSINIGVDGIVEVTLPGQAQPVQVGTIQLADFINPAGLQAIGQNLFTETGSSGAAQTGNPGTNGVGTLVQGALESSNVNVVEELVSLIETQRAYEMNSNVISTVDEMLQYISQRL